MEEATARINAYHQGERFQHALERAGYGVEEGQIRRALPQTLDLPAADDELHTLLNRFNLATPLGHLDQASEYHALGNWAAANGQMRAFFESLLDEIAYRLIANAPRGQNVGEARREALAAMPDPFLSTSLRGASGSLR